MNFQCFYYLAVIDQSKDPILVEYLIFYCLISSWIERKHFSFRWSMNPLIKIAIKNRSRCPQSEQVLIPSYKMTLFCEDLEECQGQLLYQMYRNRLRFDLLENWNYIVGQCGSALQKNIYIINPCIAVWSIHLYITA